MSKAGKFKSSSIVICTDLPPVLNSRRSELLGAGREMKSKGEILSSRVRHKGSDVWLATKVSTASSWSRI